MKSAEELERAVTLAKRLGVKMKEGPVPFGMNVDQYKKLVDQKVEHQIRYWTERWVEDQIREVIRPAVATSGYVELSSVEPDGAA